MTSTIDCRLCGSESYYVLQKTLLERIEVSYYLCSNCELLQTENPHWLEEAYSIDVDKLDTGAEERNVKSAGLTIALLYLLGRRNAERFVDYGGGKGNFTRLMRERGYNFFSCDVYRESVRAASYQVDNAADAEVVTSFEVFEHFSEVKEDLKKVFVARPGLVVASTLLHWGVKSDWWYYAEESGRHIAFYSTKTMQWIAEAFGYVALSAHAYTVFIRKDALPSKLMLTVVRKLVYRPELAARIGYGLDSLQPKPAIVWQET
jgi:2-polyprenyl-3-methyl-5-hydroxy-6-metoxy-1,4-benzoquinol methylase